MFVKPFFVNHFLIVNLNYSKTILFSVNFTGYNITIVLFNFYPTGI